MGLTPDQLHVFQTAGRWQDFRALFPTTEDALAAHVAGAIALAGDAPPTHEVHWRLIYQNRESQRRQLFALPLFLLGHFSTHHAEFRFVTRHAFSPGEARRILFGRAFGSLCYHGCFLGAIICGVGALVATVMLAFANSGAKEAALLVFAIVAFVAFIIASRSTRSLGLNAALRPIAKDSFDLLSVRAIKTR